MKFSLRRRRRHDPDSEFPSRKLVVVGDGTCGKTSLLFAFTRDEFYEAYVPTVFETSLQDVQLPSGRVVSLSLWDTAGQEAYARLRPLSYADTHAVLICYAVDSPDSFNNVKDVWWPEVRHYCPKATVLLVGCKGDRAAGGGADCVQPQAAERLAASLGAERHFVCSAKTRDGVADVFEAAAKVAYCVGKRRIRAPTGGCFGDRR